jgi:hypothetical protein
VPLTMLLKAIFSRNIFWTFSIWKDHNSLKCFIMEDPHARRRSSMQQQNITFIPETEVRYEVIVPRTGNISPVFVHYLIYSTICSMFRI